jgi:hypothetical protein
VLQQLEVGNVKLLPVPKDNGSQNTKQPPTTQPQPQTPQTVNDIQGLAPAQQGDIDQEPQQPERAEAPQPVHTPPDDNGNQQQPPNTQPRSQPPQQVNDTQMPGPSRRGQHVISLEDYILEEVTEPAAMPFACPKVSLNNYNVFPHGIF